jgi:hypothetical protein
MPQQTLFHRILVLSLAVARCWSQWCYISTVYPNVAPLRGGTNISVSYLIDNSVIYVDNASICFHTTRPDCEIAKSYPETRFCRQSQQFKALNCSIIVTTPIQQDPSIGFLSLRECGSNSSLSFQFYDEDQADFTILPVNPLYDTGDQCIKINRTS